MNHSSIPIRWTLRNDLRYRSQYWKCLISKQRFYWFDKFEYYRLSWNETAWLWRLTSKFTDHEMIFNSRKYYDDELMMKSWKEESMAEIKWYDSILDSFDLCGSTSEQSRIHWMRFVDIRPIQRFENFRDNERHPSDDEPFSLAKSIVIRSWVV